jgi:thymidylate synthase
MLPEMFVPDSTNLSVAWAQSFLKLMAPVVTEISPLVVTVTDIAKGVEREDRQIRLPLDKHLTEMQQKHSKLQKCHTVANTLFPLSLWNPQLADDANALFLRFEKAWPRISRCSGNKRGSYFRRLTSFRSVGDNPPVNQLAHIASTYRSGNHRRSALQASVFDPGLDHNNSRQLGFPCLHQVAFAPVGNNGLSVTGFYATQYLFDRAYGNYVGLCRLGRFMAKQMGLQFVQMTCIAAIAQMGTPGKGELQPLAAELSALFAAREALQ